jgi:phosphopantothenoylcysteine decarboxylase/phosphopantothenate--cysteine ligase
LRILLGITGGIAAYKAVNLIRELSELGHEVEVLPTENALRFVGKATLEAMSGKNIDIDMYNDVAQVRHVELGQQADLIIIAPATASFLGRFANGIADDLLLNALLASRAPVVVCPAMHSQMWINAATQDNVTKLRSRGIRVMEPDSGRLTGPDSGVGRLPEVAAILAFSLAGPLSGKNILVTAGATREPIDEVRFIGNHSSGRMGIELAIAGRDLGATVTLIAANLDQTPLGVQVKRVVTVDELATAMTDEFDAVVMAAAVSDFRVEKPFAGKLDRSYPPSLELVATEDVIKGYAARNPNTFTVAFALTDQHSDVEFAARQKLISKSVQMVIGNSSRAIGSSATEVVVVEADKVESISGTKSDVAHKIMGLLAERIATG